jgi:hypothetical protein
MATGHATSPGQVKVPGGKDFSSNPKHFRIAAVNQAVQEIPGLPNTKVRGQDSTQQRVFLVNRQ